jgi:hypothetical protein
MIARFPGKCRNCHGRIQQGARITWQKGMGAAHVNCEQATETVVGMNGAYEWQIEEIARLNGDALHAYKLTPAECDAMIAELRESELASRLQPVADYLFGLNTAGKLNEFTMSLWDQYCRNGKLTERQIAAVERKMAKAQEDADLPGEDVVPHGRYALAQGNGVYLLAHVWRKYGRTNVYDDRTREPLANKGEVLEAIVQAGPAESARLYGTVTGTCSRCAKRLDVRLSVALGIGPVCGKHFHTKEDWTRIKREAREQIRAQGFDPNEPVATTTELAA